MQLRQHPGNRAYWLLSSAVLTEWVSSTSHLTHNTSFLWCGFEANHLSVVMTITKQQLHQVNNKLIREKSRHLICCSKLAIKFNQPNTPFFWQHDRQPNDPGQLLRCQGTTLLDLKQSQKLTASTKKLLLVIRSTVLWRCWFGHRKGASNNSTTPPSYTHLTHRKSKKGLLINKCKVTSALRFSAQLWYMYLT